MIKRLIFSFLILTSVSQAQESLKALEFGTGYLPAPEKRMSDHDNEIIYLFDTLQLPFIDDFVRNRNKNMRLSIDDAQVIDSTLAYFSIDDSFPESLPLRIDTTRFVIETTPGVFDTIPYLPKEVVFYDSTQNYAVIDTQLFWQVDREIMLGSTTYTEILPPDTILYNDRKITYYAKDDPVSYWINEGAYRNNSFGVEAPTVGVMTFDGIDRLGVPYDISSSGTYGDADMLTSKPINLGIKTNGQPYTANDSIYLSFYYQPQGVGNDPEPEDSLSLNFYSPVTDKWYWKWAEPGDSLRPFRRVDIAIDDTLFLQQGFRLRFRNKSTLSGSLDHWNIDYVAITANARVQSNNFADVGYYGEAPSYIKTYTSMPWKHFKRDPSEYMIDEVSIPIFNVSNTSRFLENFFDMRNINDTAPYYTDVGGIVVTNLPGRQSLDINIPIASTTPATIFPTDNEERATFEIRNYLSINPDENRDNDTLFHYQYFDTYYAYDDGGAELAYSLNGTGARLAYEFETDGNSDTLRAILINFPRMLINEQNRRLNLMVWSDLSQEPIYESGPVWDVDYPDLNDFKRYPIDVPVVVSGKYYIGWEQQDNRKIYIGWDINKRNEDRLFYSLDGSWTQTSFEGSLMLRPDFGFAQINAGQEELNQEQGKNELNIYPNPARNIIHLSSDMEIQTVRVYNLMGMEVINQAMRDDQSLSLESLSGGIYILQVSSPNGEKITRKLRVLDE